MNIHNNINTHINVNLTRTTHNRNKTRQATAATGQSLLQEIAAAQMFADAGNAGGGGPRVVSGARVERPGKFKPSPAWAAPPSREVQSLRSMVRDCRHLRGSDFLKQALSSSSGGF